MANNSISEENNQSNSVPQHYYTLYMELPLPDTFNGNMFCTQFSQNAQLEFRQTHFGCGCHLVFTDEVKYALSGSDCRLTVFYRGILVNSLKKTWDVSDFGKSFGLYNLIDNKKDENLFAAGGYSVYLEMWCSAEMYDMLFPSDSSDSDEELFDIIVDFSACDAVTVRKQLQIQFDKCYLKIQKACKHALDREIKVNGKEPSINDLRVDYVVTLYTNYGIELNKFSGNWNPIDFDNSCGEPILGSKDNNLYDDGDYSMRFQLFYKGSSDVVRQEYIKLFSNC